MFTLTLAKETQDEIVKIRKALEYLAYRQVDAPMPSREDLEVEHFVIEDNEPTVDAEMQAATEEYDTQVVQEIFTGKYRYDIDDPRHSDGHFSI